MDDARKGNGHESGQQTADARHSCNASKDDCCRTLLTSSIASLEDLIVWLSRFLFSTRRLGGELDSCLCLRHDC